MGSVSVSGAAVPGADRRPWPPRRSCAPDLPHTADPYPTRTPTLSLYSNIEGFQIYDEFKGESPRWGADTPLVEANLATAVADIESKTTLRFVEYDASKHSAWLVVGRFHPDYCSAPRAAAKGYTFINLGWCKGVSQILHELLHIIGMDHEQQRFDRDTYVRFSSEASANDGNNARVTTDRTFGLPYDFLSRVHYGLGSATRGMSLTDAGRRRLAAQGAKEWDVGGGDGKGGMSELDAQRIVRMYPRIGTGGGRRSVSVAQSGAEFSWSMASATPGVVGADRVASGFNAGFPELTVYENDVVMFAGALGAPHNFAIRAGAAEGTGTNVAGPTAKGAVFEGLEWAPAGLGGRTFTYYCQPHSSLMYGTIVVKAGSAATAAPPSTIVSTATTAGTPAGQACALSAAEAAWRMWGTHTCQQMQDNWRVCTNENDPNHATVMANCPATAAMARSEPCPKLQTTTVPKPQTTTVTPQFPVGGTLVDQVCACAAKYDLCSGETCTALESAISSDDAVCQFAYGSAACGGLGSSFKTTTPYTEYCPGECSATKPGVYAPGFSCDNQLKGDPVVRIPGSSTGDWGVDKSDQAACQEFCDDAGPECAFAAMFESWCYIYAAGAEGSVCVEAPAGPHYKKQPPPTRAPTPAPTPPPTTTTTTLGPGSCVTEDAVLSWGRGGGAASASASHPTLHALFGPRSLSATWGVPVFFEETNGCTADSSLLSATSTLVNGGAVAVSRGGCPFANKARSAQAVGAKYLIVYNTADGSDVKAMSCSLGCGGTTIPLLFITFAEGQALKAAKAADAALTIDLTCDGKTSTTTTKATPAPATSVPKNIECVDCPRTLRGRRPDEL